MSAEGMEGNAKEKAPSLAKSVAARTSVFIACASDIMLLNVGGRFLARQRLPLNTAIVL
jgi:hypothetical protein